MKTNKAFLAILILFTISVSAQQKSKIDFETGIGLGWEGDYGMIGINHYNSIMYNLNNNFSLSANLGSFQSLTYPKEFENNSSSLLFDINFNYSMLKFNESRLIVGAGLSYFKGILAWDDGSLNNPKHNVNYNNNIGVNCIVKYKYRISDKWSGNIALRTYLMDPTVFLLTYSSITYGLSYSF